MDQSHASIGMFRDGDLIRLNGGAAFYKRQLRRTTPRTFLL
jgi:hypothetical protein